MTAALRNAAMGASAEMDKTRVIANNIANQGTTAFKAERAFFQEIPGSTLRQPGAQSQDGNILPIGLQLGGGVKLVAVAPILTLGSPENTGRPFDMMINGGGYFRVVGPNGETFYTRDGTFQPNSEGVLATIDGYTLADNISIPANASQVTISESGQVSALIPGSTEASVIGQIMVATFVNPGGLQKVRSNLLSATNASGNEATVAPGSEGAGALIQYHVESSNVNIIDQMVELIKAQRSYEMDLQAMNAANDMAGALKSVNA